MNQVDYNKWYYKIIYFFIVNQVVIKRALIVVLIVVNMIFWGFSVFQWTNYFLTSKQHNASMAQLNNINYNILKGCNNLTAADVSLVAAVESSNVKGSYDFLAKITNFNHKCLVKKIKYYFSYDGLDQTEIVYHQDFVLPGETKYLFAFNEEVKMPVLNNLELRIAEEELQPLLDLENLTFFKGLSYGAVSFDSVDNSTIVNFRVENNTAKNFWSVGYQIVLYSDLEKTEPLAIGYVAVNNFFADTKEKTTLTWFKDFVSAGLAVDIVPDLNVFADNVFMERAYEPGAAPGIETE